MRGHGGIGGVLRKPPFVRGFDAVDDVALIGGKGRSLQELRAVGAPVPEGVILTTAFSEALTDEGKPVPARCMEALDEARRRLGGGPLIVRSSAVGEDGTTAAFAGLLESIFPVDGADPAAILSAVRRCVASCAAARVRAYEQARKVRLQGAAVVVQRLVPSAAAGVLFTDGVMLRGEWCRGHGQALVDGAITPGAFRLDRRAMEGTRRVAHVERLPEDESPFPLTDQATRALVRHATTLERRRGLSLDLEWAVDPEDNLWIVQARPVTDRRTFLWSNANISENFPAPVTPLLVSFARAGYDAYFRNLARAFGIVDARIEAHDEAFRGIVDAHGARLYYNLSHIHAVLRLMPFGDWFVDSFDVFVGAGASSPEGRRVTDEITALGRVITHVARAYRDLPARVARFEHVVDDVASRFHPREVEAMPMRALAEGLEAILDVRLRRWVDASLADCAAAVTYRALQALLRVIDPDDAVASGHGAEDPAARHHALLKGLDVAGAWSLRALWELAVVVRADAPAREALAACGGSFAVFRGALGPQLVARVDEWLDRFGFRGSGELLLTEPSLAEEPDRLLPLLSRYVEAVGDPTIESPARAFERQRAERERETARLRARLGGPRRALRPLFDALVLATQTSVQLRERARFRQALLYTRLRSVALALGRRLVSAGTTDAAADVFFLRFDELVDLAAGRGSPSDVRALVASRRAEHAALSALDLPDVFTLAAGTCVAPSALSAPVDPAPDLPADDGVMRGVPASGGRVSGRAAVLGGLADAGKLAPGDVLVARQTDPGWAPLFFLVKGLVLERGGMLSHGSILARELGIPSVVGVPEATTRIRHGRDIVVDGDTGHVRLA
ncbi:PEP/pyruvate-binding domain-containing protein [Polyangium mundeleinium]|uniref:PEP/pyruvate-binding domain-containing protein n=1 Tax=Polyangium mundeleinium TaxID=2995306 RepID=A0ABT5EZB1_9BACT|nr:PEP/pyruvate-binding domain-containing protein [Polyangium mundeleinium]MDC0747150.1 PEP/pyruvate-binding domain-containing protein [Polyangium mundeleinium]